MIGRDKWVDEDIWYSVEHLDRLDYENDCRKTDVALGHPINPEKAIGDVEELLELVGDFMGVAKKLREDDKRTQKNLDKIDRLAEDFSEALDKCWDEIDEQLGTRTAKIAKKILEPIGRLAQKMLDYKADLLTATEGAA